MINAVTACPNDEQNHESEYDFSCSERQAKVNILSECEPVLKAKGDIEQQKQDETGQAYVKNKICHLHPKRLFRFNGGRPAWIAIVHLLLLSLLFLPVWCFMIWETIFSFRTLLSHIGLLISTVFLFALCRIEGIPQDKPWYQVICTAAPIFGYIGLMALLPYMILSSDHSSLPFFGMVLIFAGSLLSTIPLGKAIAEVLIKVWVNPDAIKTQKSQNEKLHHALPLLFLVVTILYALKGSFHFLRPLMQGVS